MREAAARVANEIARPPDWLNDAAMECVERYHPKERIPQKAIYLLEELLADEREG